jgi:hypothetical protein
LLQIVQLSKIAGDNVLLKRIIWLILRVVFFTAEFSFLESSL